jgi:coenzyme F420-reducing hydrogenase delta subunit/Pyruvate/2-oxoacid:ferredoxin oxidoreductase delta subunit
MCSGRVDPSFIIRAFSNSIDGVLIGGCWPGECHYATEGNHHALEVTELSKRLLEQIGLKPERLRIEWVSAAEGNRFAEIVTDFTKRLRELGPFGTGEGKDPGQLRRDLETAAVLARRKLISYHIDPDKCQACSICMKKCPQGAIEGGVKRIHVIAQEKCIGCGICLQACPPRFAAVRKLLAEPVPAPLPAEKRLITRGCREGS